MRQATQVGYPLERVHGAAYGNYCTHDGIAFAWDRVGHLSWAVRISDSAPTPPPSQSVQRMYGRASRLLEHCQQVLTSLAIGQPGVLGQLTNATRDTLAEFQLEPYGLHTTKLVTGTERLALALDTQGNTPLRYAALIDGSDVLAVVQAPKLDGVLVLLPPRHS